MKVCQFSVDHKVNDVRIYGRISKTLARNGYEVLVIGNGDPVADDTIRSIGLNGTSLTQGKVISTFFAVFNHVNQHSECDIYHLHDPLSIPIGIWLKLRGKKVIYDVHEFYDLWFSEKDDTHPLYRYALLPLIHVLEPILCRLADAVIVVDEAMTRYDRYNSTVIHNFGYKDRFTPTPHTSNGIPTFIYAGTFKPERATLELIKAVKHTPATKLILLGEFYRESYRQECLDYVQQNDLSDRVEFIEWLPHDKVPSVMAKADVGVVALKSDGWLRKVAYPNKLGEYLGMGLPVLVPDSPRLRGMVRGSRCGIWCDFSDPKDIARAMRIFCDFPTLRTDYGENGRALVDTVMNWENEEPKLLEVYRHVCRN